VQGFSCLHPVVVRMAWVYPVWLEQAKGYVLGSIALDVECHVLLRDALMRPQLRVRMALCIRTGLHFDLSKLGSTHEL